MAINMMWIQHDTHQLLDGRTNIEQNLYMKHLYTIIIMGIYIYMCICKYICICMYIYIYIAN